MSDTAKKLLKFTGKLLFVCLLLGILYYSFRDSIGEMFTELSQVSSSVIFLLFLTVFLYSIALILCFCPVPSGPSSYWGRKSFPGTEKRLRSTDRLFHAAFPLP